MYQFESKRKVRTRTGSALSMLEVVYHSIVRSIRKQHNNAFAAIGINMMQAVMFVAAFYIMFSLLGLKGAALRGDFLVFIMTGIFIYLTHIKSLGAVSSAEGATSPMMQHAPMTTMISITSAALSTLYVQVLSMFLIFLIYHVVWNPLEIYQPIAAFGMVLLSWFTGCALGMVFLALKPWLPSVVGILSMVYQRANMIASGKMFVANAMPAYMLAMFDWNPLFHIIDQARGFAFQNYYPRNSNWEYAFWVGVVFLVIGLMGEFFTRRRVSLSWSARR